MVRATRRTRSTPRAESPSRSAAASNPEIAPYVTPVLVTYMTFALLTWVGDPLFNLLLRFSRLRAQAGPFFQDGQAGCHQEQDPDDSHQRQSAWETARP